MILDYCDIEWFALETEIILSFFEIAAKYGILDSFVDHDGYSISPKGFLPAAIGHLSYIHPFQSILIR